MPDLMNFSLSLLAPASVSTHRLQISCQVVDSANQGTVLNDFTGANAIVFPAVLGTLTAAERREFALMIADWLVRKKAGY